MSLPTQLKSARMTDSTTGDLIDDNVGDLEDALCDIFGFTVDTNITESPLDCDNAGRITKQLVRFAAAPALGIRLRDTSNSKEFRLALNNTNILIDENTGSESSPVWTNRLTIALGTGLPTLGGATDPSAANDLTRKSYVDTLVSNLDALVCKLAGSQTITGEKTFSIFPITPSAAPDADYEVANKKYVDDEVGAVDIDLPVVHLRHDEPSGTSGGGQSSGSWATRTLDTELVDTDNICTLSSDEFTLDAGTYEIEAIADFYACGYGQIRLYNTDDAQVQQDLGANDMYGLVAAATSGSYPSGGKSILIGRFTIASQQTLRIEARQQQTNTSTGWGGNAGFGSINVYASVKLTKVA